PSFQVLIFFHGCARKRFANASPENTVALYGSRKPFSEGTNPTRSHIAKSGIDAQKAYRGSATKQRPPGFKTRYISAMTPACSGKIVSNREAKTTSNAASGHDNLSALIRLKQQLLRRSASARSLAHCTCLPERSTPVIDISRKRSPNRHE